MRRVIALALTLAVLGVPLPAQSADPPTLVEFPPQDAALKSAVSGGLAKATAAELARRDPAGIETVGALYRAGDTPGLLRSLRVIVDRRAERIADAFELLRNGLPLVPFGVAEPVREYHETMRQILADARTTLASRPRDEQARAAHAFMVFDFQSGRDTRPWPDRLREFIEAYRGTQTALLTEVDLIGSAPASQQLASLDAFVQQHPGTVAAAKALYQKGFQLHTINLLGPMYPHDGDPIERFRRVQEVVRELESGKYPPSDWVSRAPSLIVGFFVSDRMRMAPESIDEMTAAYVEFAAGHFVLSENFAPDGQGAGYVVNYKIGDLYARKGERVAGVERTLDALERRVSDPASVQLLRASFYLRPDRDETPGERLLRLDKARQALRRLSSGGRSLNHQRALATLAALEFGEGRHAEALPLFRQYEKAYPSSPWTWVARLRIGQCEEALGHSTAAVAAYLDAARRHEAVPMARALGAAYAARAFELSGDLSKALVQYQRALNGWDNHYGPSYSTFVYRRTDADNPFAIGSDTALVSKDSLAPRIAQLKRSVDTPGSAMFERARTLIVREQFEAAEQELSRMLAQHPASPLAADGRALRHRAQVEVALATADVRRPGADAAKAMAMVERVANEPHDFGVTAAKIMRSVLQLKQRQAADAAATMNVALTEWHERQPLTTRANALEEDVSAIREVLFLPRGGTIYASRQGWNGFTFPGTSSPFLIVRSDVRVKLHDGEPVKVTLARHLPGAGKILFFDTDQIALLEKMIVKLGGTERREPRDFTEVPNQPVGSSTEIVALWNQFFPARAGHWAGWVLETYPQITSIQFTNAERTKASAQVTIGFAGATVELEKEGGRWIARRLTGQWVT